MTNNEELFDVNKYLPNEINDDWFDLVPEAISDKNRHLLNITKPIGVRTVGKYNCGSPYILGAGPLSYPQCPKFVVNPFLNPSIEPGNN